MEGNTLTWGDGLTSYPRLLRGPAGLLRGFPRLFVEGEIPCDNLGVQIKPGFIPDSSSDGTVFPELVIVILPVDIGGFEIVDLPEIGQ